MLQRNHRLVEKQSLVQSPKQKLADTVQDERDIEQYLANTRKYVAVEQLDRGMLLELINYIGIGERSEKDGQKYRDGSTTIWSIKQGNPHTM